MNSPTKSNFDVGQMRFQPQNDIVLNFGQIFSILKQGWWLISLFAFVGTLIAVVLVLRVTPSYTASAQLLLGQKSQVDDAMGALFPDLRLDDAAVSGEIAILTSTRILSQVSRKLELEKHPEFNGSLSPSDDGPGLLEVAQSWAVSQVKRAMGIDPNAPPPAPPSTSAGTQSEIRTIAMTGKTIMGPDADFVGRLSSNLRVSQTGRSNLLKIRYISNDRFLAAAVPNALVDIYLEDQIDRRYGVLSRVASGLEGRLESMRTQLEEAERTVIEYQNEGLAKGFGSREQMNQQLGDLSVRLSAAQAENATLSSDLEGIETIIGNQGALAAVGLFSSPIITRHLETQAEMSELAERLKVQFGENSSRLTEVTAEMSRLEASLTEEITRLYNDRALEVELSERRAATLQRELRTLEQRAILQAEREVQLAQLEREQNAARVVYESFLDRFTETREVVDLQEGDAQVISYANPPPSPFAPNKKLSAALGGFTGIFLGIAVVFIRHISRNQVTSSDGLEKLLPTFSVLTMPRVRRWFRRPDPLAASLRSRLSPLGETVRSLRSAVLLSARQEAPAIVSVVSSHTGAGKTTTAINLARSIANVGRSCVLIDADLRRGDIARLMGLDISLDLPALLQWPSTNLDEVLQRDPESELWVIPSASRNTDPGGVLLSKELGYLVNQLKQKFEVIIFDTAPMHSGSDALPLVQESNSLVMVVPSGSDQDEVRLAAIKLGKFDIPNMTAVLNFAADKEIKIYPY